MPRIAEHGIDLCGHCLTAMTDHHLCELASAAFIPFAENANTILDFAKHIKDIVSYYINGKGSEPKFSVSDLKALHDLFTVSANDRKSETTIGAIYKSEKGDIYNNCTFNYGNSNSAQNQINKEIECLNNSEPEDSIYHRVLMQIYQVRSDADSNTGNKAIIDEIFKGKKVSLLFDSDELKNEILFSNSNPTRTGYQVDVKVQTINGKPQAYKVLALHDIMELSD